MPRERYALVGAIGHDFYTGERQGAKGFPRFTDPRCAARTGTRTTCGWRPSARSSASASTRFDLLLLHNPDRTGYTSEAVWDGDARRCATRAWPRAIGVAPGPANGFTLDLIDCFERFGERIDWAMVILNPLEPWPGELVLPRRARHDVRADHARRRLRRAVPRTTCCPGHEFAPRDHRGFRPAGWVEARPRAARARCARSPSATG